jgi:hypothetical protein
MSGPLDTCGVEFCGRHAEHPIHLTAGQHKYRSPGVVRSPLDDRCVHPVEPYEWPHYCGLPADDPIHGAAQPAEPGEIAEVDPTLEELLWGLQGRHDPDPAQLRALNFALGWGTSQLSLIAEMLEARQPSAGERPVVVEPAACEHDPECVLLYGDGPDAPGQCKCRYCCTECGVAPLVAAEPTWTVAEIRAAMGDEGYAACDTDALIAALRQRRTDA